METTLFDQTIFGPIQSRRLGTSLGVNLLPNDAKFCNFDCLYCECGWTEYNHLKGLKFTPMNEVLNELEASIQSQVRQGKSIDCITFAGNGEPTLHPDFKTIISETLKIRDQFYPEANVAVLSNGTMLHKKEIFSSLQTIDQCILKLDAGSENLFKKINRPQGGISIEKIKRQFIKLHHFLIVQTLFFKGIHDGDQIDNTSDFEVNKWLSHLAEIQPKLVMIYSLDRPTPANLLEKIPKDQLQLIANKVNELGIETQVG